LEREILHCDQNDMLSLIFVILYEPLHLICHSERVFGRGRIPAGVSENDSYDWVKCYNCDSSYWNARFFTAFRM